MEGIIIFSGLCLLLLLIYAIAKGDEAIQWQNKALKLEQLNENKSREIEKLTAIIEALKDSKKSEVHYYHNKKEDL